MTPVAQGTTRGKFMTQWEMTELCVLYALRSGVTKRQDVFDKVPALMLKLFGQKKDWSRNQTVSFAVSKLIKDGYVTKYGHGETFELTPFGRGYLDGWFRRDRFAEKAEHVRKVLNERARKA